QAVYAERDAQLQALIAARLGPQQICLQVWNKVDVLGHQVRGPDRANEIWISAQTGDGLPELQQALLAAAGRQSAADMGEYSARGRHLQALQSVQTHLRVVQQSLGSPQLPLEVVAEELRLAQTVLSAITGEFTADDLLGEIFSRFCIGK
ncbi:MAG: tRNA uridine-5-carboxymethylaminomethyl(34) synthesis GTPase MnmE, partial [Betaproteobacteria bacterium]|nr:tRNA uridine-5-carboxymethylaminomethyl(34) synthesis GTPase MnmE [Betaproteobacteria bacterium]